MTLGERIRKSRKSKNMTQRQLASMIGAAHNSVSDWENNKNKPDPDTIELICGILDVTPNYILGANDDVISPSDKALLNKYHSLDRHGKEVVDMVLDAEWNNSVDNDKIVLLNAAHERTDINVTSEMNKTDDDTMNNSDF